ncbi:MAG: hypothetical protein QM741_13700 [Rudaea sp.]|uniref:hypothetical protein n=1 Tax=Rudaea sp. TaxID=2136325 RepID=UPI0039E2AACC
MATKESNTAPFDGDFSDRRVFICRPDDKRLTGANWPQTGGFEQRADGPTYLVIGSETDNERCSSLAKRFGFEATDLIRFREQA